MATYTYKIVGMDCAEEIAALRREVGPLVGGPENLAFDLINAKMTVTAASRVEPEHVERAVASTGMRAVPWETAVAEATRGGQASWWRENARALACAISGGTVAAGFAVHAAHAGPVDALRGAPAPAVAIAFYAVGVAAGAGFVLPKALATARRFRADMNVLMSIAVTGAMVLGEWFEAGSVSFLFALALLLESWSVGRARRAIRALMDLAPQIARYRCPHDGDIEERPVGAVPVGVEVLVRPGERIPLDGVVSLGRTTINEAPITGESKPIEKTVGDTVYAGTINNEGAFEFRVSRKAEDTTLARIIRMVEEAQGRRAPSEQWVETFARYYTPAMMAVALLVAVLPPLLLGDWPRWAYEGLVILVIACPCALVISTPVSIVAGLATAARAGVLIKGGAFLEQAGTVRAIALDKTGTLTYGTPQVQRVVAVNGFTESEVLAHAAALEIFSEHPIAQAILRRAALDGIEAPRATAFRAIPGRGAEAMVDGVTVWVGSHRMLHDEKADECAFHEIAEQLEDAGHSVVAVGRGNDVLGFISLGDTPRPDAAASVQAMKRAGVETVRMITGDNEGTARAVAESTRVDSFAAELLPEEKVAEIDRLRRTFGNVAMIGDGVNDAPAMAAADLGIAMAAVGSDAAIETADIALMSDELSRVPWLIRHARRTRAVIRQNIAFALGVKALFLALALAGYATLWLAIAADMGASLAVIFNALRLLRSGAESDTPLEIDARGRATPTA